MLPIFAEAHLQDAKTHPRYWSAPGGLTELHCFLLFHPTIPTDSGGQNCFGGDMGRKAPIVVRKQRLGATKNIKTTFTTWLRMFLNRFDGVSTIDVPACSCPGSQNFARSFLLASLSGFVQKGGEIVIFSRRPQWSA